VSDQDRETRERILDAAHAVFLRRGAAGARTQEIADEAGVNKALLHYYFGTKTALADAVFERAASELFPMVFRILQSETPLEEKVRALVPAYLDFLAGRPYLVGFVASEMHAHPERVTRILAARGPIPLDVLRRQIAVAVADGGMRPIAPEQFVVNLVSLLVFPLVMRPAIHALLQVDPSGFADFIEERKRALPDFFLAALRP
jgi:AcrR family transcriptional regulator